MDDLISRQTAIDDIETVNPSMPLSVNWVKNWVKTLPPAQPEVTKEAVELYCRQRCLTVITNELFTEMKARWSQLEIIRCRECRHYRTADIFGKRLTMCKRGYDSIYVEPDDFCSYAERRTNEVN